VPAARNRPRAGCPRPRGAKETDAWKAERRANHAGRAGVVDAALRDRQGTPPPLDMPITAAIPKYRLEHLVSQSRLARTIHEFPAKGVANPCGTRACSHSGLRWQIDTLSSGTLADRGPSP